MISKNNFYFLVDTNVVLYLKDIASRWRELAETGATCAYDT